MVSQHRACSMTWGVCALGVHGGPGAPQGWHWVGWGQGGREAGAVAGQWLGKKVGVLGSLSVGRAVRITCFESLNAALGYFCCAKDTHSNNWREREGAVHVSDNCSCPVTCRCFAIALSLSSSQMCEPDLYKPVIKALKEGKNTKKTQTDPTVVWNVIYNKELIPF